MLCWQLESIISNTTRKGSLREIDVRTHRAIPGWWSVLVSFRTGKTTICRISLADLSPLSNTIVFGWRKHCRSGFAIYAAWAFNCIWWPVLFDKSNIEAYPEDNAEELIVLRLNF